MDAKSLIIEWLVENNYKFRNYTRFYPFKVYLRSGGSVSAKVCDSLECIQGKVVFRRYSPWEALCRRVVLPDLSDPRFFSILDELLVKHEVEKNCYEVY